MKLGIKYTALVLSAFFMLMGMTGCGNDASTDNQVEERARAVKVQVVEESERPDSLLYIGTVDAKDLTDISTKVGGKILKIYVEKGDPISVGDLLYEIDPKDIEFQVDAAKAQLETAKVNIVKAKDSLSYYQESYGNIKKLYDSNSVTKDQHDQMKLQLDVAQSTFDQAEAQYNAAKADYDYKQSMISDSKVYASVEGTVVNVTMEENERVGASKPVVIVRSKTQVVNIGIAQKDLNEVLIGGKAVVDVDGDAGNGVITYISEAPDQATRTYNAEIEVSDKTFRLGSIANVTVDTGIKKGIWVPAASIFANGEDYIYIVKEGRAFKRTIEIVRIDNELALVKGLEPGESIAVSGMKNLNDGSKVNIVE